jgi:eukaryotic-like serine/threonine-protein kinase
LEFLKSRSEAAMSLKEKEMYQFGPFVLDPAERLVSRDGTPVSLTPKVFDTLVYLVRNHGRLLTKDELLKEVWPDTFVEEVNLAVNISTLRKVLGEGPQEGRYIATVSGQGYRFVAPVEKTAAENGSGGNADAEIAAAIPGEPQELKSDALQAGRGAIPSSVKATSGGRRWLVAIVVVLAIAALATTRYFNSHREPKITEKDTIVLADFANSTGDSVFDDTLKTGLSVALNQSPFLNVISDNKVAAELKLMTRPPDTKLTPDVVRELCQRAGSKAYIAGSIATLGSQYVVGLKAVNCQSGDTLAQEQATAAAKEKVLDALGKAASKLRGELGESLATVQKFDVPLMEATTPSLEALKAYSLGKKARGKGTAEAVAHYQRAIELDPNFAMGYLALGNCYNTLGETARTSEYLTKAFELRERASEREKLIITAIYYEDVTGELEKAIQTVEELIESYPHEGPARGNDLGNLYAAQGQWEKAREAYSGSLQFRPERVGSYDNLANSLLALQRFDDARKVTQQAQERHLSEPALHNDFYALAFLTQDSAAVAAQQQWFTGPEENLWLALASDTEAYAGHLRKARELTKQSVDSAVRGDSKEAGAIWQEIAAQREAAFGNLSVAKQAAEKGLALFPGSQGVEVEAALALAMAGDAARAEGLMKDLNSRFARDTQIQSLWLPTIQAEIELHRKNSGVAVSALRPASSIELGQIYFVPNLSCMYHTYVRGEAYLADGQGGAAAGEFQKILDHGGIVWNCWTGALAHLGLARANAMQARSLRGKDAEDARVLARAGYKGFLTLWKDADPDVPILKEAKAEYAKLQ